MTTIWEIILNSYSGYWNYLVYEISNPSWKNYFYYLIVISLLVWLLEFFFLWRKDQKAFRKDFWLDVFYMFFNFFIFSLLGFNAISNIGEALFNTLFNIKYEGCAYLSSWPTWIRFSVLFILVDFVQWLVHIVLHRVNWMWQFHKVHHSVTEMSFNAHLRFHWMEQLFYKSAVYIPFTIFGCGLSDLFIIDAFNILIGHINHANINITYGPLKYILNNPAMHIWHHAKKTTKNHPYGVNFGITLSIWDYLFKTAHIPRSGRDIALGFKDIEHYPKGFIKQSLAPFKKNNTSEKS